MSRLTGGDLRWLEDRLRHVAQPVEPSPAFVDRAREALSHVTLDPPRHIRRSTLVMVVFALSALVASLLLLMRRPRSSRAPADE